MKVFFKNVFVNECKVRYLLKFLKIYYFWKYKIIGYIRLLIFSNKERNIYKRKKVCSSLVVKNKIGFVEGYSFDLLY